MDSASILFHPTRADGAVAVRRSQHLLARLREGWRPDDATLSNARHAEQWMVRRDPGARICQFVGYQSRHRDATIDHSALIIGSALAIAPEERWVLLAGNTWVTLGAASAQAAPLDPAEVTRRAEAWLRTQLS